MFKIFLILFLPLWLYATSPAFETFRAEERALVLREFKALYKERQSVQQSMRQMLKHARARALNKKHLTFFQPKNDALNIESPFERHQIEASNVFFCSVGCEGDCASQDSSTEDTMENSGISSIIGETTADSEVNDIPQSSSDDVRQGVISPWARK